MLVSYILEIAKMDVEIVAVLRKKPTAQSKETLKYLDKMQKGNFLKDNWSIMYKQRDRASMKVQRCCFYLPDKNLYSTSCLEYVLGLSESFKEIDDADNICFVDIMMYITVRNNLLGLMTKVFKVQNRIQ
ncbi:unnamed protein product [Lactuca saligna]|uniref:Uncharacterized protein n=1 Tax=Lactuca saligna TaxID=75948 RepID=A0AA36ELD8_LACSI|nr:unnamed protein product [Lactuca saligna]